MVFMEGLEYFSVEESISNIPQTTNFTHVCNSKASLIYRDVLSWHVALKCQKYSQND